MKPEMKKLLEEKELSQAELADEVGVTPTYMSYILRGLRTPAVDVAKRIAERLGVTLDELVGLIGA